VGGCAAPRRRSLEIGTSPDAQGRSHPRKSPAICSAAPDPPPTARAVTPQQMPFAMRVSYPSSDLREPSLVPNANPHANRRLLLPAARVWGLQARSGTFPCVRPPRRPPMAVNHTSLGLILCYFAGETDRLGRSVPNCARHFINITPVIIDGDAANASRTSVRHANVSLTHSILASLIFSLGVHQ
jgi:hypothetical protein